MTQQAQQADPSAKMQQLLAKCWTDEDFKKRLLADSMATLKAEGVEPPAGLTIKVLENTSDTLYLTIPAKQTSLSDDDLDKVAGGSIPIPLNFFGGGLPPVPSIPQQPGPNIPTSRPDIFSGWKFTPRIL